MKVYLVQFATYDSQHVIAVYHRRSSALRRARREAQDFPDPKSDASNGEDVWVEEIEVK